MSVDQIGQLQTDLDDLTRRYRKALERKSELKGQLDAKKQELVSLVEEIKKAGYDPKKLREERDKKAEELSNMMSAFNRELVEVEKALEAFDQAK